MVSFLKRIFGSSPKIDPHDLEGVVKAYGAVLGKGTSVLRSIDELPLPKHQIKEALLRAIALTPAGPMRNQLEIGFVSLGDFQDLAACKREGKDPVMAMASEARELLHELRSKGVT